MALPKEERLKEAKKFSLLFREGKSIANNLLVLYYKPGSANKREAGFTVGKKLGGAVTRNKFKRRMKEAYRSLLNNVPKGYIVLFIARQGILKAKYPQILAGEKELLKKAGIWKEEKKS